LDEENKPIEKFFPFASNVPFVNVTVLVEPTVRLSDSSHVPPIPLKVIGISKDTELLVIVLVPLVAEKVVAPVLVEVMPTPIVKEPAIFKVLAPEKVPVNPVKFKELHNIPEFDTTSAPAKIFTLLTRTVITRVLVPVLPE
jgi:hypothetical protein